jgi:hypothetical protein
MNELKQALEILLKEMKQLHGKIDTVVEGGAR